MPTKDRRQMGAGGRCWLAGLIILGWALAGSGTVRGKGYTFTTLAGQAGIGGTNDGVGSAAQFDLPFGIAVDSAGYLRVADYGSSLIRFITPNGAVSTYAGQAWSPGTNDGVQAKFNYPSSVAIGPDGFTYIADTYNQTVRKTGGVGSPYPILVTSTLAGQPGVAGTNNGTGNAAQFHSPVGIAVSSSTNIYVVDFSNHAVRVISPAGTVTTFAGQMGVSGTNDGWALSSAQFSYPTGVAVDTSNNVYVADNGSTSIRKIWLVHGLGYFVSTIAGKAGAAGTNDGVGTSARFKSPYGITVDNSGNLFITDDYPNNTIRKMSIVGTNWVVTTIGGTAGSSGSTDGIGAVARFNYPANIAVDSTGMLYVSDWWNNTIRKGTPPTFYLQDTNGNTTKWCVNGSGVLQQYATMGNMGAWKLKAVGDLSTDGRSDYFWQTSDGWVVAWLSTPSNTFTSVPMGNLGAWGLGAAVDVDGDGIPDLIWQHSSSYVTAWYMNSNCTQRGSTGLGNLGVWKFKGAGDVNGDGKADLFFQSPMGDVVVWMSQAGSSYQGLGVGNLGAWELRTVADLDGDGVADLIWENPGGWVVVWYLNADGTLRNSAGLGNIGVAKIMAVQ